MDTTELQARLAALPASDLEIASKLGVWPQTVRNWRVGRKSPSRLGMRALLEHYPELAQEVAPAS